MTERAIGYTGGTFDRAGERRLDDVWIAAEIAAGRARVVPVWRGRNLVTEGSDIPPRAVLPGGDVARFDSSFRRRAPT